MKQAVAIIGAGFSGISTALRLRDSVPTPLTIYLIERSADCGGLAYSTRQSHLTMNGMAERLSAFDESPNHFVDWLHRRDSFWVDRPYQQVRSHYALRRLYGDYLRDILSQASGLSPGGAMIKTIHAEVTRIDPLAKRYRITTDKKLELIVDGVVLATGYLPPRRICEDPWPECLEDPWNISEIEKIPVEANVLIVGMGQTMMDVAFSLACQAHKGQIHAISRRGLLAQRHADRETQYPLDPSGLPKDINSLVRFVRTAARKWMAQGGDWRAVMNSLRPHTQKLWIQLPAKQKRRFLEHLSPYWRIHRTRIPPYIWNAIHELQSSGQLKCISGRIKSIKRLDGFVEVKLQVRGAATPNTLSVQRVINCSGPDPDYQNATSRLLRQLFETGIITSHPTGVGLHVAPNGAIISHSGEISTTMFVVGPACMGTLLEINVIREIRRQAREVAEQLSNSISGTAPNQTVAPITQMPNSQIL